MVNFTDFPGPLIEGVECFSASWSIAEKYFDFGGKCFKIEQIKANKYTLKETESHTPLMVIVLKIILMPLLGLVFLSIRSYFRKKHENKVVFLPGNDAQTRKITQLKDNALPKASEGTAAKASNSRIDEVKTEVDLEDAKNVKEFRDSLSLLFVPPKSGQEKKRNNELAKALKTGYKVLEKRMPKGTGEDELDPWGNFGVFLGVANELATVYEKDLKFWSREFWDQPVGNTTVPGIWEPQSNFTPGFVHDKKTGLLVATSIDGRKFALLEKTFFVNGNHFAVMAFDPIKKKYIECNNFKSEGKEITIPGEEVPDIEKLFKEDSYQSGEKAGNPLLIDLEYVGLFLHPEDWKGLNWVLPRWEENNCYLAASWLEIAYKMKVSEIFFKRSGIQIK